tara:strand:- start:176 stop:532 length:357 start_codon:yes stop_codon:yes gene_type:complete
MRQNQKHKHAKALLLLSFCLALLGSCNLERFRHEKYSCNNQRLDIYDIIVRHAKKGSIAKVIGSIGEYDATITSVNSKSMMIEGRGISLQIDRSSGRTTAQKRNKYYSMECKVSVFTL